jgi:RecJ-like exonuclease
MTGIEVHYISKDIRDTLAEVAEVHKQLEAVFSRTASPLTEGVTFDGSYLQSLLERLKKAGDPARHALVTMQTGGAA